MGWRGILAGVLALAALERLLVAPQAAGRVGGIASSISRGISNFLSPDVPAFPTKAPSSPTSSAPASSGSSTSSSSSSSSTAHTPSDLFRLPTL